MHLSSYPDLLSALQQDPQLPGRRFIAIIGAPGSGKTTLVDRLVTDLEQSAKLPMDGFHFDNETLAARQRLHRKGAPDTFDTSALKALLNQIAGGGAHRVPTFDRDNDRVVPDGALVPEEATTLVVEGNYLLLDAPGWRDLRDFWDVSVMLDVPVETLEARLTQRWLDQGMPRPEAEQRARENDLQNAETVLSRSFPATHSLTLT